MRGKALLAACLAFFPAGESAYAAYATNEALPYKANFILLYFIGFLALSLFWIIGLKEDNQESNGSPKSLTIFLLKWSCILVYLIVYSRLFYSLGREHPGIELSLLWYGGITVAYYAFFTGVFFFKEALQKKHKY